MIINDDKSVGIELPRRSIGDFFFKNISSLSACLVLGILLAIIASLFVGSYAGHKGNSISRFVSSAQWNPVTKEFGALAPIFGTLVTSCIAMLIAIPVSFGIALFLTQLAPSLVKHARWAPPLNCWPPYRASSTACGDYSCSPLSLRQTLQPWFGNQLGDAAPARDPLSRPPDGHRHPSTAALILAIMIIPFISSVMRDVFDIVPPPLKESAYALGATTWEVVWRVVLPYTKAGVLAGIMLGLGRALGETMAVTFVIGNAHNLQYSRPVHARQQHRLHLGQ